MTGTRLHARRPGGLGGLDFAHFLDVSARSGNRELRAVKIPASYDAWRPPKRRKNDSKKISKFFRLGNQFFVIFSEFCRS